MSQHLYRAMVCNRCGTRGELIPDPRLRRATEAYDRAEADGWGICLPDHGDLCPGCNRARGVAS